MDPLDHEDHQDHQDPDDPEQVQTEVEPLAQVEVMPHPVVISQTEHVSYQPLEVLQGGDQADQVGSEHQLDLVVNQSVIGMKINDDDNDDTHLEKSSFKSSFKPSYAIKPVMISAGNRKFYKLSAGSLNFKPKPTPVSYTHLTLPTICSV